MHEEALPEITTNESIGITPDLTSPVTSSEAVPEFKPVEPLTDLQQAENALRIAQYNDLMHNLINICIGKPVEVSVAALVSCAASVLVSDGPDDVVSANRYLIACFNDVLIKLPDAYAFKKKIAPVEQMEMTLNA